VWCATHCGVTHFRGVVASSWVKWPLLSAHKLSCSSRRGPASLTSDTRRGPHKLVVESHRALPQAQFSPHRGPRTVHFISVCSSVYESNMNNRDQVDPSGKQDSNIFCMVSNGMLHMQNKVCPKMAAPSTSYTPESTVVGITKDQWTWTRQVEEPHFRFHHVNLSRE
jgi:hypothetical protein